MDVPVVLPVEKLAERGGFEPPVGFYTYGALAKRCFRPLSHLSGLKTEAKKQRRTTQSARSFIRPFRADISRHRKPSPR
jgi:hypothetical protein